jgi:hypothetical protein
MPSAAAVLALAGCIFRTHHRGCLHRLRDSLPARRQQFNLHVGRLLSALLRVLDLSPRRSDSFPALEGGTAVDVSRRKGAPEQLVPAPRR